MMLRKKTSEDKRLLHYFVQKRSSHISNYQKLCGASMEVPDMGFNVYRTGYKLHPGHSSTSSTLCVTST